METDKKIALSVKDAAALIGVSVTKMYDIMHCEDADFAARIGGRILISRMKLEEWIAKKAEEQSGTFA